MYSEANQIASIQFGNALTELSDIMQANVLKEWLYQQKMFTGGMAQREVVRRALYCMDAHCKRKEIARIGTMEIERAFR